MFTEITLLKNATELVFSSADGQSVQLSAEFLRANAMDASSRRERLHNGTIAVERNIQITSIKQMGLTGLNICFSDGNNKAIFPYQYLQSLVDTSADK